MEIYSYQQLQSLHNDAVFWIVETQRQRELLRRANFELAGEAYMITWFNVKQTTDKSLHDLITDRCRISEEMKRRRALVGFM